MFLVTAHLGQPHGSAKSARDLARALLAIRNEVCIVSPWNEDFGRSVAGYPLSRPHWYKYRRRVPWSLTSPLAFLRIFLNPLRRWRIRRAMQGQHIIVNGWASYAYWKDLAVTGYCSASIVIRESPHHFQFGDHSVSLAEMLSAFSGFDRLIFVSEVTRESWMSYVDLAGKPAFTLPNCCEEEEIECVARLNRQQVKNRLGFGSENFVAICPGHIERRKGHDLVLDVLPELVGDVPNLRLVVLGDPGSAWANEIAEKIDSGAYGRHVVRIPAQPSALEYLYAADVLLFPSRAESLPRTVLEGMAFGMPIIATNVDGVPELIEHGVSGWLFHLDNLDSMREGLSMFANQPDLARSYGEAAQRRYYKSFSRSQQIERARIMKDWISSGAQAE